MTASGAANGDAFALPIGTVTFLLTDVEGSTLGWQAAPTLMGAAIARHYEILDVAVATHGGVRPQEQGEGDSIVGRVRSSFRCVASGGGGAARIGGRAVGGRAA